MEASSQGRGNQVVAAYSTTQFGPDLNEQFLSELSVKQILLGTTERPAELAEAKPVWASTPSKWESSAFCMPVS